MKTCTFVICFLLSAIASFASAPARGNAGVSPKTGMTDNPAAATTAFTICLEAENANSDGPVSPDPNASGGLTRGAQNGWDYFVEYATDVPTTATYSVTFRYYTEQNSLVNMSVNGAASTQIELPSSHSWNINWTEHTIKVNLTAGHNRIRLKELPGYDVRHDKTCWTEIPGTGGPITCDFKVKPRAVGTWPIYQPGQTVTLDAGCTGNDCGTASLAWIGNGINVAEAVTSFNAPATPGDYTYTLFAHKNGCTNDTSANVTIRVQTTPAECDFIVGSIVSDLDPSCGQGISASADCFGTGCAALTHRWTGPGVDVTGSSVNFHAPSENGVFTYTRTSSKPGCPDKTSQFQLTVSDCGNAPFKVCIESEDAGGTGPVTQDPNASGGKTRGGQDRQDYTVYYTVPGLTTEGPYAITFRYYAETNTAIEVQLNSEPIPYKIELPASNSWNIVWKEYTLVFGLRKGLNIIYVKGLPGYSPVRHDRICIEEMPGTGVSCDFNVTGHASTPTPQCGSLFTLSADCTGPDCGSIFFNWYGPNGFARYTQSAQATAPSANGTYTYTLVAGREGCVSKNIPVNITVNSCSGSGGATFACVEAENSASNGAGSSDPNASNGQTRGSQNDYNYYVDYQLDGFAAGTYPVTLRYYAEATAKVSVSVNGNIALAEVQLPPTNSWNIVAREETFWVTLVQGQNTIRIQGLPGTACRQDKICVGSSQSNARMAAPEFPQSQTDAPLLEAYPNPAPGEFKAVFHLKTGETGSMQVTDIQGKVWHRRNVTGKGTHHERIDLHHAPAGIYLLQVKKPDSVETKKILLTR